MMHVFNRCLPIGVMVISLALVSCMVSRHPAGIASSTAPVSPGYTIVGSVEASSCSYWVFYVPVSSMDSTEAIIDSVIKEKGAQALVGVTVEHTRSAFALPLVGSECTVLKGQAVRGVN
jgi:hypothetical protein